MRFCVLALSILMFPVGLLALEAADREMPYKAYIASDGVYVRSGPGKNYYPTGKLSEGTEIEVYRHDPGGWYAIRPPKESYTWVSARYLEIGDDGLATVIGDQVAARVGSQFSDIRDVIQVRLHEGEIVEILGEKDFSSTGDDGRWYKIAPPAGEFRWIFGRFVDPDYMSSGIRHAPSDSRGVMAPRLSPPTQSREEPEEVSQSGNDRAEPEELIAVEEPGLLLSPKEAAPIPRAETPPGRNSQWVSADTGHSPTRDLEPARPERQASHQERASSAAAGESSSGEERLGYVSPGIPELNETDDVADEDPSPAFRSPPVPFQEALDQVELELARMLAEEPTVWSFSELQIQVQSLMEQARTALERGKVRLVMNKIERSADIKQRYGRLVDSEVELDRRESNLGQLRGPEQPPSEVAADEDPERQRFDGAGRLARVVSPNPEAPQYALVDGQGRLTCYVTPAPGVNLRYHVGSRIGIHGTTGYIAERQARHLTARHVTPLETARSR